MQSPYPFPIPNKKRSVKIPLKQYSYYLLLFKFQFNKHIKKAEGQKTPKVELTISVDGVTVQDPKTKV